MGRVRLSAQRRPYHVSEGTSPSHVVALTSSASSALVSPRVHSPPTHTGSLTLHWQAWYLKFDGEDQAAGSNGIIPRPHSVDLNGDGKPEFVTTTPGGDKLILAAPRKGGDGFQEALKLAQVDLESLVGKGRRVIALAHGSLDPPMKDFVHSPRKQVVAALCSDGQLMLLDSNLKLRWKSSVPGVARPGRPLDGGEEKLYTAEVDLRDVSLVISPHGVNDREKGMIVVSIRKYAGRQDAEDDDYDEYEHERMHGEDVRHERGRSKDESLEEVDTDPQRKYGARHVSYFAFSGTNGNLIWAHRPEDFHKDPHNLVEHEVKTLYTDRLMTELDSSTHYGQKSCKDYRESVLASLPHAWYGDEDSTMQVAHFRKHRNHHGSQKHNLQQNQDDNLMAWQQKSKSRGVSTASTASTASTLSTVATATGSTRVSHPNVLIAHTEDAMEVIHIFSGRPVCRIPLEKNVLHIDVNGDGVIDHVHAVGGTPKRTANHIPGHEKMGACMARVTSGIPASVNLFNGTVCSAAAIRAGGPIDVAPPVALAVPGKHGHYASKLRQKSYVFFFNSRGEVTAFDHQGDKLFTEHTGVTWKQRHPNYAEDEDERDQATESNEEDGNDPVDGDGNHDGSKIDNGARLHDTTTPTFQAFPFRRHALPTGILAAGSDTITILSEHGRELWTGDLPQLPIQKIVIIDVNFDGYNDLILVTDAGLFGWVQYRAPPGTSVSALAGGMLVVMLTVIISGFSGESSSPHRIHLSPGGMHTALPDDTKGIRGADIPPQTTPGYHRGTRLGTSARRGTRSTDRVD